MIELLGKQVRDKVTGFTGTATAKTQYITGCDRYYVEPTFSAGAAAADDQSRWFDVDRLIVI